MRPRALPFKPGLAAAALGLATFTLATLAVAAPKPATDAAGLQRFDTPAPVWSMAPLKSGLALGELPRSVVVASREGKALRSFDVGGLPLALAVGQLSPGGPEVIAVAAQDAAGSLYCLANDPAGLKLLWKFSAASPFLSVAVGDIDGDGKPEVAAGSYAGLLCVLDSAGRLKWQATLDESSAVSAVAIGDLDGDGRAEVVAGTTDSGIFAFDGAGKRLWRVGTELPGMRMKKEGLLWVRTLRVLDVNGDGRAEVVAGSRPSGMVTVLTGDGKLLWRRNFPDIANRWTTAFVEPADLNGDGKPELACLLQGIILKGGKGTTPVLVLGPQGERLADSFPKVSLVCLGSADLEGKGRRTLLLGSATRGTGYWAVRYGAAPAPFELPRPQDALDALVAAVGKMPSKIPSKMPSMMHPAKGAAAAEARPIHVLVPFRFKGIDTQAASLGRFLKGIEAPNLKFELMITTAYEAKGKARDGYRPPASARRGGRNLYSRDQLVAGARTLEKLKVPFYFQVAKICLPWMRPSTCEAILEAAPTQCRGFLVNENAPTRAGKFDRYVAFAGEVMDACHRHGDRKFVMDEYLNFWSAVPADPRYLAALFKPAYRNVLVPMHKTTQLVAPEQMMGMIVGLWKSGTVAEWGYCAEDDAWKWEAIFMNPPHDATLRMEAMAAALGATYFRIEENREFIAQVAGGWALEEGTPRHRGLFHELVRKGAVRPAQDASELVVSPLVLRKAETGLDGRYGHNDYWQHAPERRGLWGNGTLLQSVRDDYPFAYLYDMRYGYDGLFPETPYGWVAVLPPGPGVAIPGTKAAWTLAGDCATPEGGQKLCGGKVREGLLASAKAAAEGLPFSEVASAEGCTTIIRAGQGGYTLYLLDPGQLEIKERQVALRVAHPESLASVTDAVSGEKLAVADKMIKVTIPAGTLRVLEVRLKAPGADTKKNNK